MYCFGLACWTMTQTQADLLNRFPVVRTSDADQVASAALSVFGATRVELASSQLFEVRASFIKLSSISLAFAASSTAVCLDYPEADYVRFQVGLKGRAVTLASSKRTEIDANKACITSPARSSRMICDADHERLTLRLDQNSLQQKLTALLGGKPREALEFDCASNLNHPRIQSLWQLIRFLAGQLDSTSTELSPLVIRELEQAILVSFLCANRNTFSHLLDQDAKESALSGATVRRVEEYIEAHWNEAVNIETLVDMTGVRARAIFKAFQQGRGYSPIAFARMVRLKRARDKLSAADPDTSVTGVAFSCGFANVGNFARYFREAFGEYPSETLSRAKRWL